MNESLWKHSLLDGRIVLLCSLLFISGCSALDIVGSVVKPKPGIEVETEIVVGDKREEIATGAVVGKKETVNTTNTAETIEQTFTTVNEAKTDYLLIIIALIGWILPSPRQLWLWAKSLRK